MLPNYLGDTYLVSEAKQNRSQASQLEWFGSMVFYIRMKSRWGKFCYSGYSAAANDDNDDDDDDDDNDDDDDDVDDNDDDVDDNDANPSRLNYTVMPPVKGFHAKAETKT